MPEVLPDFPDWLTVEVDRFADQYSVARDRAWPAWAMSYIYELDPQQGFDCTDTLVVGDGGVDGWHYGEQEQIFVLTQAKWSDNLASKTYSASNLDDLIRAFAALSGPASALHAQDNKLLEMKADFDAAQDNGAGVVLAFVTAGRVTEGAKEQLKAAADGIGSCEVIFYDLQKLSDMRSAEEVISALEGRTVEFRTVTGTSTSKVTSIVDASPVEAMVATLDGKQLGDVVGVHQPSIFHANIRYSLGRRNKVNKGIRETITNPETRSSFWLFNNGITVICDSLDFGNAPTTIRVTNPQIVNGAQTCSSLADLRGLVQSDEVAVQARFIEISSDRADASDLVRNISKYTNSQSPVRTSDLRSNEPRHVKLQAMFDMIDPPVFYERRRGEWTALSPAQRARYGNPARRVSKEEIGQRWRAFSEQPAQAISKKDEIFSDHTVESSTFDTRRSAELYMLANEIFESALDLMNRQNAHELKALVPGWFVDDSEAEHLVALRKAPRFAAAYATALVHEVLIWRYSSIGRTRAAKLRELLAPGQPEAKRVWRIVFKSLYSWANSQTPANIKGTLAADNTFSSIRGFLQNELAGEEKAQVLPSIS